MNALEYHAGMLRHFGIRNSGRFLDVLEIQLSRTPRIDPIAFDEWLHAQHGTYEDQGLSMAEALEKFHGAPARAFIESLI